LGLFELQIVYAGVFYDGNADLRTALGWSRSQLARVMNRLGSSHCQLGRRRSYQLRLCRELREIENVYHETQALDEAGTDWPVAVDGMEEFEGRTPAD